MSNSIITAQQIDGNMHMVCKNEFCIKHAKTIKEILLESSLRTGNEVLTLTEATAIDVTGIQLAFIWRKTLLAQGRKAEVLLPMTENLKDILSKTGITKLF